VSEPALDSWLEDLDSIRERARDCLASVRRVLAVTSGKGGVGKSAVAVNLALALAQRGARVGILDADLHGPSVAKMLGLRGAPVRVADDVLRPNPGPAGLRVQSMDFFLQGAQALDWDGAAAEGAAARSALELAALGDLLGRTDWGTLDALVVDLAPGADRLPAFARLCPGITGALAVTIPTEVSLLAVERGIRRLLEARIPLIGIVENMGSHVCAACGHVEPLFHEASADRLARDLGVTVVGRIPFDRALAAAADAGAVFLEGPRLASPAAAAFAALAECVSGFEPPPDRW
jgi:ATP-binding protein involved in chromosome partitioning